MEIQSYHFYCEAAHQVSIPSFTVSLSCDNHMHPGLGEVQLHSYVEIWQNFEVISQYNVFLLM